MKTLNQKIEQIIIDEVRKLDRPDLLRQPLVAVSSANDPRYAKLKEIIGEWHLNPTELLPDAQSVISYFIPMTQQVVADPKICDNGSALWGEAYVVINDYFEHIGQVVSDYLQTLSYSTYPISGTHTYDPKDLKSMWSHRSAAAIAGLGAFGANRLLITQKGSGGRLCTILTSAPLEVNQEPFISKCIHHDKSCNLCFSICPVGALKEDSFDRFLCHDEVLLKNEEYLKDIGVCDVCGKCISVCPFSYIE